jgi:hypothetical protein
VDYDIVDENKDGINEPGGEFDHQEPRLSELRYLHLFFHNIVIFNNIRRIHAVAKAQSYRRIRCRRW